MITSKDTYKAMIGKAISDEDLVSEAPIPATPTKADIYPPLNEWQLCPKCNGSGLGYKKMTSSAINTVSCDLCNGKKIISKVDGKPPTT